MVYGEVAGAQVRLWLVLLMYCGISVYGGILYVCRDASSSGDGSSWSKAMASIQRAIDSARPGDEIWISGGVYYPENVRDVTGESCYASSFELKDGVSLFGGFAGWEGSRGERRKRENARYPWEFASETVLSQRRASLGGVVLAHYGLEVGCELNGLTLSGGRALGGGLDGKGGGLRGAGRLSVRLCRISGNTAWSGGGIAWRGPMLLEDSECSGNRALGEGGCGGGCAVYGDGFCVRRTLVVGNGRECRGISGGGIYACGRGIIGHCTVCGNAAEGDGGGVWLGGGAHLVDSIVWGNTRQTLQVWVEGAESHCDYTAIEGTVLAGQGNWLLSSENSSSRGSHVNGNYPGRYFVCFRSPERGDYRLGSGSYALKRSSGQMDLGAFQTGAGGNLAVALRIESPKIYGSESSIAILWGAATPAGCTVALRQGGANADIRQQKQNTWRAVWTKAGKTDIAFAITAPGGWNSLECGRRVDVLPRPLVIAADDASGESPELTWYVEGGQLCGKDRIEGALAIGASENANGSRPIQRGTLRVEDRNNGGNYAVQFHDGAWCP